LPMAVIWPNKINIGSEALSHQLQVKNPLINGQKRRQIILIL